jgi:hypothetical protein
MVALSMTSSLVALSSLKVIDTTPYVIKLARLQMSPACSALRPFSRTSRRSS